MVVAAGPALISPLIAATGQSGVVDYVAAISAISWQASLLRIEHIRLMGMLQTDGHGSLQRAAFGFFRPLLLLCILRSLAPSPRVNDNALRAETSFVDRMQQASKD